MSWSSPGTADPHSTWCADCWYLRRKLFSHVGLEVNSTDRCSPTAAPCPQPTGLRDLTPLDVIKRHSGVFPESDAFVERAHRTAKAEHPGQDDAWKRVTREVCCPREQRQAWPPCSRVAVIFAMTVPDVTGPRNVGYQWWRGGEQDQRRNGSRRSFSWNNFNARRGLRIRWSSIGTEHVSS